MFFPSLKFGGSPKKGAGGPDPKDHRLQPTAMLKKLISHFLFFSFSY